MLERTNTIEPEETIEIAVETAQAHISLRNDKKNNTTRHVAQAEDILRPYYDTEIETLHLKYKRDVVKARIFSAKKKYDEALELYETALGTLQEEYEGDETPEEAKLFVEMAETAALQNYRKRSGNYYRKAYDIFQSLGMEESAKNIEDKLPADDEFDDDEEEDNKYDNDDGENEGEYAPHPPDDDYSNRYQRNEYNDDTNNDDGEYAVAEPPPRYGDDNYEEEEERTFKVVEPPPRDLEEQQNNIAVGLLGDSGAPAEEDQPETLHFDMKDKLNNQGEEEDAGEARERALTSDQPAAESDQPAAESDQPAAESDQIAPENPESEHPDSEHPESEQPVAAESDHPPEDNVESDKPAEAD
ncbi:hypothetical protein TRFO_22741 [Tritrichomonas foetus]|uniref:Uncharacterized protein n=1 Tax=Tritrichomonas foetus TaxID=1144522 RepID=A0A1J4KB63_9EUKA|nr:hypothetical protein TRFO_22741 [Tritrichomonas foetus]|eukprot:OHT08657.1 hypothetical protein TRFO_22741 [Tritrichomonas foetus]